MEALFRKGIRMDNVRFLYNKEGAWPTGLLRELLWVFGIDEPPKERRKGVNPPKSSAEILEHLNQKAVKHLNTIESDKIKLERLHLLLQRLDRGEKVKLPKEEAFVYMGPFASTREKICSQIKFYEDGTDREWGKIAKNRSRRINLLSKITSGA